MPSPNAPLSAPLPLAPIFQSRPWGGVRLRDVLGKALPEGPPIGEAWEVSDRPEGSARVAAGPLAGKTLAELMAESAESLVGAPADRFPLLFKFLDCREVLSLQVHPDDAAAAPHGDLGKEEAWFVIEAEPEAHLYIGFRERTSAEAVRAAIAAGRLDQLLSKIPARAGDVFHLPPGTVHAIGPGLVLGEIQQSSNLTYRLYDWGRVGLDGQPRELHLEQGLAVMDLGPWQPPVVPEAAGDGRVPLVDGDAFAWWRLELDGAWAEPTGGRPWVLATLEGEVTVSGGGESYRLVRGRCAVVPAAAEAVTLAGTGELLLATTRGAGAR